MTLPISFSFAAFEQGAGDAPALLVAPDVSRDAVDAVAGAAVEHGRGDAATLAIAAGGPDSVAASNSATGSIR